MLFDLLGKYYVLKSKPKSKQTLFFNVKGIFKEKPEKCYFWMHLSLLQIKDLKIIINLELWSFDRTPGLP